MTKIGEILVSHLSNIGELPEPDRTALASLDGAVEQLPRLTDCLQDGDHPTNVVIVLKGLLFRYTVGHQGVRQIHSFYLPTEAPCLETLYIDYMDNNLGAVVDSAIALIPHDQLYAVIDAFPHARKLLWRQTLVQGGIFREWLVRNSNQPAHAALAHLFCEMFTRAEAAGLVHDGGFDFPVTQDILGEALGLTAVHVNRTMQMLRQTGTFELRSRRLQIIDFPKLAEIAEFDPRYLHLHR
jgi:CRP-like cAMP-binding protein